MIANFFNKTKPVVLFTIVVCLFVYLLSAAFVFKFEDFSSLFFIKIFGSFLLIIVILIIVNFVVKKNRLTRDNSYALLLVVVILGTFNETLFSLKFLLANIALLLSYRKVYSLRSAINTKSKLFDASLWLGVAALISEWSLLFVILIYIGMTIYQKIDFKNIFIPMVGLVTPIFIFFAYCLLIENIELFYNRWLFETNFNFVPYNQLKLLIPITFLLAIMFWSVGIFIPKLSAIGVNAKRSWVLGFNHLLISMIFVVVSPIKNGSEVLFMVFPLAVISANFLQKSPSENFKNLVLYLFFGISIVVYFL